MDNCRLVLKNLGIYWKTIFIIVYPFAILPIFLIKNTVEMRCMYVLALMAGFWVLEAIPIAITSLLPLIFFPLMGILDTKSTSICYFKEVNMMFVGGLIIALAVEYCHLHIRLALKAIILIGCSYRRLHFGLVTITMLVSMWISNTAATAMMLPIIQAVLQQLEEQGIGRVYEQEEEPEAEAQPDATKQQKPTNSTMCFYISTAYASSIGGLGTLVGSGTNLSGAGMYKNAFKDQDVSFSDWMIVTVPLMLVATYLTWFWLQFWYMGLFRPASKDALSIKVGKEGRDVVKNVLKVKLNELGPCTAHEILVGCLFVIAALLWLFRAPGFIPGWPTLITKTKVADSTPAMIVVAFLFLLPAKMDFIHMFSKDETKRPSQPSPALITWRFVHEKMHWNLIFLLGGGFALAEGMQQSGLGTLIADVLSPIGSLNRYWILLITCGLASFVTQFTANVSVSSIMVPIVIKIAVKAKIHPIFLAIPVCISCSFSHCLPVATPPNAIVAAPINMNSWSMIKSGWVVQIICLVCLIAIYPFIAVALWDTNTFPDWAVQNSTNSTNATKS